MIDGGKGSKPRPFSVDQKTFDANWNAIFGRKKKSDQESFDQAIMKNEYYDLEQDHWDAYSGLPNPDAYRKDDDANKS